MIREKINLTTTRGAAAGFTPWRNVANESAWASISVSADSNFGAGAKLKFYITHEYPHPNIKPAFQDSRVPTDIARSPAKPIEYPMGDSIPDGIEAPGLYDLTSRIGGVWGCIGYSGVDEDTNIDVAVNVQMV